MIIEKTCTVTVRVLEKKHRQYYKYPTIILCINLPQEYLKYASKKINVRIRIELPNEQT